MQTYSACLIGAETSQKKTSGENLKFLQGGIMKYIGQIFTGGWHQKNYSAEEIIRRLTEVMSVVPLDKALRAKYG